jgi:hypothetical protein
MKVLIVGSGHVGITGSELASGIAHELPHLKIVAEPEPYVLTDPYAIIRQATTFTMSGQDNRRARRKKERQTKKKIQCQSKKQSRKR